MKRGESGLSLVVSVQKPLGMTSHDVVSRCRRIFGEKRVGHAGTLDPAASGVLLVCVGNATRLDSYLVGHDKTYVVDVAFGVATDTDDAQGTPIATAALPSCIYDERFAATFVKTLVGPSMQVPPKYSAIKKNGKKACDEARKGNDVQLEPRPIEIYGIDFLGIKDAQDVSDCVCWSLRVHVSKGTYIRSFARDLGQALGTVAHVATLERVQSGAVCLSWCASLEALEQQTTQLALDPVELLGFRFMFANDQQQARILNGNALDAADVTLMEPPRTQGVARDDCCTPRLQESARPAFADEPISVVYQNKLAAIYRFDDACGRWKADCVFQTPVSREGFVR